jgi:inner membrane protein
MPRLPVRSMGLKLLLVCALVLVMCIPALFVFGVLNGRTQRAEEVAGEISALVGGRQSFLGPVVAVPYVIPPKTASEKPDSGVWVVYPTAGKAAVSTRAELRRRSLFAVPIYQADARFDARFDFSGVEQRALRAGAVLDWSRSELMMGASDSRGAKSDVILTVAGQRHALLPAGLQSEVSLSGADETGPGRRIARGEGALKLFGMSAAGLDRSALQVSGQMSFSGARRVSVLPFAKTTEVSIAGTWASPSFDGAFLPGRRRVGASAPGGGFDAEWSVPYIARGVPGEAPLEMIGQLGASDLGVTFVQPANPYQSVERALKYAPLFLGLVFLAYFVFETTTGRRVHPAQYLLVGLAQSIFYLLLLAIAEHLGFDLGFLAAAGATVGLISAYAGWVFESRAQGVRALACFSGLYGLIYVLMRLEDYALLVGAAASFVAIALVMYLTRRVDWYGAKPAPTPLQA